MGIRDWLAGKIAPERITEASSLLPASIDPDPHLWRPLTAQPDRALPVLTQERGRELAFHAWTGNPLGRRMIEMLVAYVMGDGVRIRASEPAVQAVIDRFWNDPVNKMDARLKDFVRSLFVFGETFFPLFVNEANGTVRLGYIDPAKVAGVALDENNALVIDRVMVRGSVETKPRELKHVRFDDETGLREGEIIMWSVNRAPNASRGSSDLLPVVDWLDGLDTFLIAALDRIQTQNCVAWDLQVEGASRKDLSKLLKSLPPPRPNMIRAHNQRTKWNAVSPNIQGDDLTEFGKMLKVWIGIGLGFPPHWLGEPGDSNRATASESGQPVIETLKGRQGEVKGEVAELIDFVIDRAIAAGQLAPSVDRTFDVVMSTIWAQQTDRIASATVSLSSSLGEAQTQGWISQDEAGAIFRYSVGQLGIDLERVDEDTGDRTGAGEEQQATARRNMNDVA